MSDNKSSETAKIQGRFAITVAIISGIFALLIAIVNQPSNHVATNPRATTDITTVDIAKSLDTLQYQNNSSKDSRIARSSKPATSAVEPDPTPHKDFNPRYFKGNVRDSKGNEIVSANISLTVNGKVYKDESDSEGKYKISVDRFPNITEKILIRCSKGGYENDDKWTDVHNPNQNFILTLKSAE